MNPQYGVNNVKKWYGAALLAVVSVTSFITYFVFNTNFAHVTIDAWSFFAAAFLMIEGAYRIMRTNDPFWPLQAIRVFRVIIGTCVLTIHTCQVIYGI